MFPFNDIIVLCLKHLILWEDMYLLNASIISEKRKSIAHPGALM